MSSANPYDSPLTSGFTPPSGATRRYPIFCYIAFGTDLAFCLIAVCGVMFNGYEASVVHQEEPGGRLFTAVVLQVISGTGIALFGIPGNLFMILKQKWAAGLAGIEILFTLASLGAGAWASSIALAPNIAAVGPAPFWIGVCIEAGIRLSIVGLLISGIVVLLRWEGEQRAEWRF